MQHEPIRGALFTWIYLQTVSCSAGRLVVAGAASVALFLVAICFQVTPGCTESAVPYVVSQREREEREEIKLRTDLRRGAGGGRCSSCRGRNGNGSRRRGGGHKRRKLGRRGSLQFLLNGAVRNATEEDGSRSQQYLASGHGALLLVGVRRTEVFQSLELVQDRLHNAERRQAWRAARRTCRSGRISMGVLSLRYLRKAQNFSRPYNEPRATSAPRMKRRYARAT